MCTYDPNPDPVTVVQREMPALGGAFFVLTDAQGDSVAIITDPDQDRFPHRAEVEEANAKHVAACWNAFRGIPTSQIEMALRRFPNDIMARRRFLADILMAGA